MLCLFAGHSKKNRAKKPIATRFFAKIKPMLALTSLALVIFTNTNSVYASSNSDSSVAALAPQQAISLKTAIGLTLAQHPELRQYQFQEAAAQARVEQAGVGTPMTLNLELEDGFGTGTRSGINNLQSTLSISWLLEQDKIDAKVKLASAETARIDFVKETKALDLAAQTARFYITLLTQQEQLKLAKLTVQQTEQALANITKRVKAGQLNAIDKLRAQADLSKKHLVVEDLTHELETSKAQLIAQWSTLKSAQRPQHVEQQFDFIATDSLLNIPDKQALEQVYLSLKDNPRLALFATEQRIQQSAINLARATAKPSWQVSAGVRRAESVDDFAFVAGISIPLADDNRNQGQIRALHAQQEELQANADAWQQRAQTQLFVLSHKLNHSRHVIERLSNDTLPTLEQASRQAEQAYNKGNYSYTEWYTVQQELLTVQNELISAYQNIHLDNIELERLTGTAIPNK